jgi:hypothetical protein
VWRPYFGGHEALGAARHILCLMGGLIPRHKDENGTGNSCTVLFRILFFSDSYRIVWGPIINGTKTI